MRNTPIRVEINGNKYNSTYGGIVAYLHPFIASNDGNRQICILQNNDQNRHHYTFLELYNLINQVINPLGPQPIAPQGAIAIQQAPVNDPIVDTEP